jgi:signal peptidase I
MQTIVPSDAPKTSKHGLGGFWFFLLCVLLVRSFLVSPFRIPSGSMIPSLLVGDTIVVTKFPYGWSRYSLLFGGYLNYFKGHSPILFPPKRGDIVVFTNPNDTREDWIKRLVGLPGDTVQMNQGKLYLNGVELLLEKQKEGYKDHDGEESIEGTVYKTQIPTGTGKMHPYSVLKQAPFGSKAGDNTPLLKVPEGHYFFMGDNWDGSGDSRFTDRLGFVPQKFLLGRALFIFFSLDTHDIYLKQPWTWFKVPFRIRFGRTLNKAI